MYCKHCGKEIADDAKFCQHCGGHQETVSTVDSQNIESATSKNNPQEIDNTGATRIDYIALLLAVTIILVYDLTIGDYESGAITFGEFVGQFLLYTVIGLGALLLTLRLGLGLIFGLFYLLYIKLSGWRFKRRK